MIACLGTDDLHHNTTYNKNLSSNCLFVFSSGYFDERMNEILDDCDDGDDNRKGFLDPNTEENLSYLQLISRCIQDEDTGLLLLPLVKTKDMEEYIQK